MVAYFIRLSTSIFGSALWAIRLPAVLCSLLVFVGLLLLAPRGGLVWGLLFSPLALIGSVLITPDLPLVLFWLLYLIWFSGINTALDSWNQDPISRVYQRSPVSWLQWIFGGVLLGFGGLSKYTMLLAIPCSFAALISRTRLRAWGSGYALHLLVAGLLVSPVFFFNWKHGFSPFFFQWTHSMSGAGFSVVQFFRFVGGQIFLVGALPFLLFPWIVFRRTELCSDARSQAYFWFYILPLSFFLFKAFRGHLEANWAVVAYLSFFPLADRLLSWSSFKEIIRAMIAVCYLVPWLGSAAILVHLFFPLSYLEPRFDRIAVLRGQWETAQNIQRDLKEIRQAGEPFYLANYQWTSYFRYLAEPSEQIVPSRPSEFTLYSPSPCNGPSALSLDVADAHAPGFSCFTRREILKAYTVIARGREVSVIWLVRYNR
jgi:4-amino-4-deoxy-L-arabinose transferase-like glycosyltransferase